MPFTAVRSVAQRRPVPFRSARRAVAVLAVAVAALAGAVTVAPHAAIAADVPTVTEAPDYATETFGDPWDYSNTADQNTDRAGGGTWTVAHGKLSTTLKNGTFAAVVDTMAGSLPYGRDGQLHPVDTSRYTRLSFSMTQPYANRHGAISWFTCRERNVSCMGGVTFSVQAGTHTYDVPLDGRSVMGSKLPWHGSRVVVLRIQPVLVGASEHLAGTADIDWMRLHGGTAPSDALPPGDHGDVRVSARPVPVVDSPNPDEGADLAKAQGGRSWILTNPANASGIRLRDASLVRYSSSGMTARNAGPLVNDPEVNFPVRPFSGTKYHWLSWRMTYPGAFDLHDRAGGGKMARLIWNVPQTSAYQVGNDVLTFSGANAVPTGPTLTTENRIDLTAHDPLDESMKKGSPGWRTTITALRWDPNEDRAAALWTLRSLTLRADPAATGWTTVRFHDAAWTPGTTATVRVVSASAKRTLVTGMPVAKGSNAVPFTLGSMPAGAYRASVTLTHPDGTTASAGSIAPVVMSASKDRSHDPRGVLDRAMSRSGAAHVTGWATDPDTRGTLHVRITENARVLMTTSTGGSRADVVRSHPGTPGNTGFAADVPLASGTHTLCATAVSVGSGAPDAQLGCTSVTVP